MKKPKATLHTVYDQASVVFIFEEIEPVYGPPNNIQLVNCDYCSESIIDDVASINFEVRPFYRPLPHDNDLKICVNCLDCYMEG